jgi:hypothetical protein
LVLAFVLEGRAQGRGRHQDRFSVGFFRGTEIDDATGLARRIATLRIGPGLEAREPDIGEAQ